MEGVFRELRRQALRMSLYGRGTSVVGAVDSTFIHAYSRRKRKAGVSDRGARVGKVERTTYALGWRVHSVATEERLPLCYAVRSANVNDRVPAPKLMRQAVALLGKAGSPMRVLLADPQYYGAGFFSLLWGLGVEAVIPAPCKVKEPLIRLRVKRGFILEGDPELLKLYRGRMMVEHVFKSGKGQLNLDNLRSRGVAKVRMHVALCYSVILAAGITATEMHRPELNHTIKAFQ